MSVVFNSISQVLSIVLKLCYQITRNYGISIILFTVFTKLILFPVNIIIQKNSIKIVRMQPKIDALKIKYIDDKDKFIDEQVALYKENHYHAYVGIIPLILQLTLVLGLLDVIYKPLTYLINIGYEDICVLLEWLVSILHITDSGKSAQIEIIHQIQMGNVVPVSVSDDIVNAVKMFNMNFCGLNLGVQPSLRGEGAYLFIPFFSGISAWIMCTVQNRVSVIQKTAGNLNKYGMTVLMVAFSVYFSFLVPSGVGLYWICGNLFSVPSMFLLNALIPPRKYIDMEYLNKMQEQKRIKEERYRIYHKKERADYKRFFRVKDMQLMIYSESNGFYKYYSGMIDYICEHSDIQIHYVTSDPEDNIFTDKREQIHSYYIAQDKYLIPLFMKLDCDMCIMTMPDLEKYHIKRSRVRKDIEYVYISHGVGSNALTLRKGALDWYDTMFCVGIDSENEVREMEQLYNTRKKTLVEAGYMLLDEMIEEYDKHPHKTNDPIKVLIAPSWQTDNIIELCIDDLLNELSGKNYEVILRPHPQMVRHSPEVCDMLKEKYRNTNIEIQTDFSKNSPVMEADILITDWSDISYEFAFVTKKPVLFVNTPMKVMNPEYDRIKTKPITIELRNVIGKSIDVSEISYIEDEINDLLSRQDEYSIQIEEALNEHVFNVGKSKIVHGRYVIKSLCRK